MNSSSRHFARKILGWAKTNSKALTSTSAPVIAAAGFYYYANQQQDLLPWKFPTVLAAQKDPQMMSFPRSKWDHNWDLRQVSSEDLNDKENEDPNNKKVPTATRHILLIRHGQYNLEGKSDAERILTELGRNQAKKTGDRLAELKLPYTKASGISRDINSN